MAQQIGYSLNDKFSNEQADWCFKIAALIAEGLEGKHNADVFLAKNSFAEEILKHSSDTLVQNGMFSVDTIGSTLSAIYALGYVAAKSPDKLQHYFTILTSRPP